LTSEVYAHQFTVPTSAIDARNHVNNLAYLQWCMDAAEAHWKQKATTAMKAQFVWYVLNHFIEYKASAFEGELLEVHTWVTETKGVKSTRKFKIFRIKDNQTLVEAQTRWCMLDAKTLRPAKIPEEICTLFT